MLPQGELSAQSVLLVLGGVRSGKSHYAQNVAERSGSRVTLIATARRDAGDAEMSAKIARHELDRPDAWRVVEEPLRLAAAINDAAAQSDVVLVDCLTLFAANLMDLGALEAEAEVAALVEALRAPACAVVLVSNEVGSGVVPAYASGRQFRDSVGELNQCVAAAAQTVVYMVAGLPMMMKGSL